MHDYRYMRQIDKRKGWHRVTHDSHQSDGKRTHTDKTVIGKSNLNVRFRQQQGWSRNYIL